MIYISILLLVVLGYMLKKLRVVKREIADSLIRLVFYVFLPATLFYSLVQLELKKELLLLPLAAAIVALACYAVGYLIKDSLGMKRGTEGVFLVASGAMNQGLFSYPFFLLYLGTKGLSYVAFYDVGQAILSLTLGYYIAIRYGKNSNNLRRIANKILTFPPLWAFSLALIVNYLGFYPSIQVVFPLIKTLHNCTVPVIMLSLGIFLEPRITNIRTMMSIIFIRFLFALGIAFFLVSIFNLEGIERITVLIASTVPPAMLTLIYAVEENLDVKFTVALLSVCMCIGLIYTPLLFEVLL